MLESDQFSRATYDRMYERVSDSDGRWILAGTFYKRQWQERFRTLDDVLFVCLEADLETCLERNRQREDPIDEAGGNVVWREFDEPDADVRVDATERSPEEIVEHGDDALEAFSGDQGPADPDRDREPR